jgi:hypothetical protein
MRAPFRRACGGALAALGALACNVAPTTHDHCDVELERVPGCPAGALVVMSDFSSSQVALAGLAGETLCGSLISSAGTEAPVPYALSGDVLLPSSAPSSGRAVLLDSYGTNVVSFLDPASGRGVSQLPVGTGFEATVEDYLEIDATRALVSRWADNPVPGQEPFDAGGDLLVIDTQAPQILGEIPLPRDDGWPPHPAGLTRVGDEAWVTLQRFSTDVRSEADAELVGISLPDLSVAWTLAIAGLKNCGAVRLSPDGTRAVLACTGYIDTKGAEQDLDESGLVVLDTSTSPPSEIGRLPASDVAGEPLQAEVAFFGASGVLVKTQTALHSAKNNRLLALDIDADPAAAVTLLAASPGVGGGKGVVYGGMFCTPGCANHCLVADADRGVIARFTIDGGTLSAEPPLAVSGSVGLPPRAIGGF